MIIPLPKGFPFWGKGGFRRGREIPQEGNPTEKLQVWRDERLRAYPWAQGRGGGSRIQGGSALSQLHQIWVPLGFSLRHFSGTTLCPAEKQGEFTRQPEPTQPDPQLMMDLTAKSPRWRDPEPPQGLAFIPLNKAIPHNDAVLKTPILKQGRSAKGTAGCPDPSQGARKDLVLGSEDPKICPIPAQ